MGSVDDDSVGTGVDQCLHTLQRVGGDTNAGSHTQTTFLVLAGHGLVLGLGDILIGDEAHQPVLLVHDGQLFNLVPLQNLGSIHQIGMLMGRHQVFFGHHLLDQTVQTAFKTQVTIGDNAYQTLLVVNNGYAANVVFSHDVKGLGNGAAAGNGHWVVNHTILGTLHDGHLTGLVLNTHVLVNDTDTAFTGNGNGHLALGHGVHGSSNKGHIKLNVTRETGAQLYRLGEHFGISGNEQDVVESETVHHNLVCNK